MFNIPVTNILSTYHTPGVASGFGNPRRPKEIGSLLLHWWEQHVGQRKYQVLQKHMWEWRSKDEGLESFLGDFRCLEERVGLNQVKRL